MRELRQHRGARSLGWRWKTPTYITVLSLKDLTKEELRRLLQTLRDIEQNDKNRPIGVTINVSSLSRERFW